MKFYIRRASTDIPNVSETFNDSDNYFTRYTIDINSFEELFELIKKVDCDIIVENEHGNNYHSLLIYDDYIE